MESKKPSETGVRPKLILFDVNETLLDMSQVKKQVNEALDSKRGFQIWFGLLLQYAMADTLTGNYHPFNVLAGAALDMAAVKLGVSVKDKDKATALHLMAHMPPHKEVKKGLELLKKAGYRLATLTNSTGATQLQQLGENGLLSYFEATLSIDEIKKFKPAISAYHKASLTLGVLASEMIMVAAHGWDIYGAMSAGLQGAFISRKGQELFPLGPQPVFKANDLVELANQIIAHYKAG